MRPNFTADYDNGISIAPGADTPPALTARSFGCELADSRTATQSSIRELDPRKRPGRRFGEACHLDTEIARFLHAPVVACEAHWNESESEAVDAGERRADG